MAPPAAITRFHGPWHTLSNFHPDRFLYRGQLGTAEHHFQAAKTLDTAEQAHVYAAETPADARARGRTVTMSSDWEGTRRYAVMDEILAVKFEDPQRRAALLATGTALLVEGVTWHDQTWGDCSCPKHAATVGANRLGRALMTLREHLHDREPGESLTRAALTGHRPEAFRPDEAQWVRQVLPRVLDRLQQEYACTTAISGFSRGADMWWACAAESTGAALWAYLPTLEQGNRWGGPDQQEWERLRVRAERTVVVGQGYDVRYLYARNELMLRDADVLVAVHLPRAKTGGAASVVRMAVARGVRIIRVNPEARTVTRVNWHVATVAHH